MLGKRTVNTKTRVFHIKQYLFISVLYDYIQIQRFKCYKHKFDISSFDIYLTKLHLAELSKALLHSLQSEIVDGYYRIYT